MAQDRAEVMIVQCNWEDFFSNLESFYKIYWSRDYHLNWPTDLILQAISARAT